MPDIETLNNEVAAVSAQSSTRKKSAVEFPQIDIDESVANTTVVYNQLGMKCLPEQFAAVAKLGSHTTGAYFRRIAAAQKYGLVVKEGDDIRVTELGRLASSSSTQSSARVQAFLNVELYKKLYEAFRGAALPDDKGLEKYMRDLGVPEKSTETARQIFKRSARQAGFFQFGEDRLTMPANKNPSPVPTEYDHEAAAPDLVSPDESPTKRVNTPNALVMPTSRQLHQAIIHALETLPEEGEAWPYDDLEDWLDGFKGVLRLVYKVKRPSQGY